MRARRKGLTLLLAALLILLSAAIGLSVKRSVIAETTAAFQGIGKSVEAEEQFAFAADAEFSTAEAAGLAFGKTESGSYAFLVNRKENRVKLVKSDGETETVLEEEPFVGPANMNAEEEELVKAKTATLSSVSLQVVLTKEEDKFFVSFYADGIERFVFTDGSAPKAKLEAATTLNGYTGGELGYFKEGGEAEFTNETVSESEISLYSELYRNRFHYSQNRHWNNDPNGLVYYEGYYHLYYQHYPFGETWGDMYWGHARSQDLVHWENLPIALVPDKNNGEVGYMWSGSALVYHKGESTTIDGWFGDDVNGKNNGDAVGLLGYYTRHQDNGGNKNTGIMISRNGGLSWEKKSLIPCTVSHDAAGNEIKDGSWRDPKVFNISSVTNNAYKWGMALTDMEDQYLFFLKSNDLVNWTDAGYLRIYCNPECPDVIPLTASDHEEHFAITLSSRYYFVCDFGYENEKLTVKDPETGLQISALEATDKRLQKMEYGPDSYAAQTFYIEEGKYAGKAVGLSWFSGMPNAAGSVDSGSFRTARKGWNGGGMTIPVIYGLVKNEGYGYTLTEMPVVKDDTAFEKTLVTDYSALNSHCLEIQANIVNPTLEPVSIRVNVSADGQYYTEIGWNKRDGYFVDRTHTETAGVAFPEGTLRFASRQGKQDTELNFYILVDNGGVEVFAKDFTVPFYLLTLASPHSTGLSVSVSDSAQKEITVNEISDPRPNAGAKYLNVSATEVELDDTLAVEADVLAYAGGETIFWRVAEGDSVSVEKTGEGATLKAVKAGNSVIEVTAGSVKRTIRVSVAKKPETDDDLTFTPTGAVAGEWHYTAAGLSGTNWGGDGFLLSEESGSDFYYTASFDLGTGAAAAIVFRATEEEGKLKRYLIANYDKPGRIVKLWSENGELGRAAVEAEDLKNLKIAVKAKGTDVRVYFNGAQVIRAELRNNDPLEGRFGLNACATRATFRSVEKTDFNLEYAGEGALSIRTISAKENWTVRNAALNYRKVDPEYVSVSGRTVTISEEYLETLPEARSYVFVLESGDEILTINVALKTDAAADGDGNNVALIVSLSVVFGVLALAAAGTAAFLILKKRAAKKKNTQSADESDGENNQEDQ